MDDVIQHIDGARARNQIDTQFLFYFHTPIYPSDTDNPDLWQEKNKILETILKDDPVFIHCWDELFFHYLKDAFQEIRKIDKTIHKKYARKNNDLPDFDKVLTRRWDQE